MYFYLVFFILVIAFLAFFLVQARDVGLSRFQTMLFIVFGWLSGMALFYTAILVIYDNRMGMLEFVIENTEVTLTLIAVGAMLFIPLALPFAYKSAIKERVKKQEREIKKQEIALLDKKIATFNDKCEEFNKVRLEIDRKEKDLEQRARVLEEKFKELDLEAESRRSADSDYKKQINSLQKALSSSRSRSKDLEHHRIYSDGFARYCEETLGMNTEEVNALKRKFKTEHQSKQQAGNNNPKSL